MAVICSCSMKFLNSGEARYILWMMMHDVGSYGWNLNDIALEKLAGLHYGRHNGKIPHPRQTYEGGFNRCKICLQNLITLAKQLRAAMEDNVCHDRICLGVDLVLSHAPADSEAELFAKALEGACAYGDQLSPAMAELIRQATAAAWKTRAWKGVLSPQPAMPELVPANDPSMSAVLAAE